MARRRKSDSEKMLEALLYTPLIVLGQNKRSRRSAARKWLRLLESL